MRLLWLAEVLRQAGLRVVEYPNWQIRGAEKILARMDPQMVIAHHTATTSSWPDSSVENLLAVKGNASTPPPLCHLGLRRDGTYVVIASGVANHAGKGQWKNVTGNKRAIGIEAYNTGKGETWSRVQLDAYDEGCAALLEKMGRDASWLVGHKEFATPPGRKIDPFGINMNQMRLRVQTILDDEVTLIQARIEVATKWHARARVWMTPQGSETAQMRLGRLAQEVVDKVRTADQIAANAPLWDGPIDVGERVPAWVLDASIPA